MQCFLIEGICMGTGREVTFIDRVFEEIGRGVAVIPNRQGKKVNGMSACWVTRPADRPFLLAAGIWESNFSYNLIEESASN